MPGDVSCATISMQPLILTYCIIALWRAIRAYQGLLIGRPRIESKAKVVQANTHLHDHITRRVLPQPDCVFDNAQTLDRANDVFDTNPTMSDQSVFRLLLGTQLPTTGLFVRHRDLDI